MLTAQVADPLWPMRRFTCQRNTSRIHGKGQVESHAQGAGSVGEHQPGSCVQAQQKPGASYLLSTKRLASMAPGGGNRHEILHSGDRVDDVSGQTDERLVRREAAAEDLMSVSSLKG